jgi:glycosyltransferase involved in cell wall biosynthesis
MKNYSETNLPYVSIIIPCRNEKKYIGKCLDSIIFNDYPKNRFEVLVVDGMSNDGTREIVKNYSEKYPFIKILDNPKKFTCFAFNIGVKEAKGKIIMLMGAHAGYEKDYISKCLKYLKEYKADNVGGIIKTVPKINTLWAKAIAYSLSSFFGVGTSYFRRGSKKPKWVDTVFGGCYKKEVFDKVGLFNEKLIRSQDFEFNKRLKKAGGKILLVPEIVAYYYPQSSLKDFLKHYFRDGVWTTYPLKFGIRIFSWRHLIPLFFVSGLIGLGILSIFFSIFWWLFLFIVGFYFLINIYFSFTIAKREKDLRFLFLMPITFVSRHLGYGLGPLWGLIKP